MPTIMEFYNTGLAAAANQIKDQYLPESLRLANQNKGLVNQFYAPNAQSEINFRNANTNKINSLLPFDLQKAQRDLDNPLLGMTGAAGQIGAARYLEQLKNKGNGLGVSTVPSQTPIGNNSDAKTILDSVAATNRGKEARANWDTVRANNYNWTQLPAETRNNIIAQGLGMGVDPIKMKEYVTQGLSIPQIAEKEGLDPKNIPSPIYYPTTTTKSRVQQAQQVGAELDYLSSATTPILSKYADTFFGKSPKLIGDMLSTDPEKQKDFGRYLGAMAVQAELANGRVLLAGGRSGIEIVRDLREKSLKGMQNISPIKMSKEAFEEAQKTIDTILQKGAKIRTITGMAPFSQASTSSNSEDLSKLSDEELQKIVGGG